MENQKNKKIRKVFRLNADEYTSCSELETLLNSGWDILLTNEEHVSSGGNQYSSSIHGKIIYILEK